MANARPPKKSTGSRNKLQAVVGEGIIRRKTADMLAVAFSELAYRKQHTRSDGPRTSCYEMAASVASAIIVEMEDSVMTDLGAEKRLAVMKQRVEKLLQTGPPGNDWQDPAIRPNARSVLVKTGLMEHATQVRCYRRMAVPIKTRSKELKQLQQQLLDKNVKAGVLDVEVAQKVTATPQPPPDYATVKDIRQYQKKVRRIVRLLYKRGELPSSFVQEIEKAADIDIADFDRSKALRNDMRYYLRSAVTSPDGDEILTTLENQRLIPPARNYRLVMRLPSRQSDIPKETREKLAKFEQLTDSKDDFELPGDGDIRIEPWRIPNTDIEYRRKMRRVCRALLRTGLITQEQRLARLEELIGIPILGKL